MKSSLTLGSLVVLCFVGSAACARQAPLLISPEQAQDRVFDHRSQAEAAKMTGNLSAARMQREAAGRYQRLVKEGRTTTPDQALARAGEHGSRAEAFQRAGRSRFVQAELDRAATYEDFALGSGRWSPDALQARASEHRARAAAYDRMGWTPLARHHQQRAKRVEEALRTRPPAAP
jgi:hypothetical protein